MLDKWYFLNIGGEIRIERPQQNNRKENNTGPAISETTWSTVGTSSLMSYNPFCPRTDQEVEAVFEEWGSDRRAGWSITIPTHFNTFQYFSLTQRCYSMLRLIRLFDWRASVHAMNTWQLDENSKNWCVDRIIHQWDETFYSMAPKQRCYDAWKTPYRDRAV